MFKVKIQTRRGIGSTVKNVKTWLPAENEVHLFKDFNHAKDYLRSVIETRSDLAKQAGKYVDYHIGDDFGKLIISDDKFCDLIICNILAI